jgi:hypothetical protein
MFLITAPAEPPRVPPDRFQAWMVTFIPVTDRRTEPQVVNALPPQKFNHSRT